VWCNFGYVQGYLAHSPTVGSQEGAVSYERGTPVPRGFWGSENIRRPPSGRCFFFFTLVTGPRRSLSLKLSDERVYEPQIRARLGTAAHLCEVVTGASFLSPKSCAVNRNPETRNTRRLIPNQNPKTNPQSGTRLAERRRGNRSGKR